MHRTTFFTLTACCVALGLARDARAEDASDKARALFNEASAASDAKDYAKCIAKANEAWTHFQHAQIRGLRGACNASLGNYRAGVIDLAAYVEKAGSDVAPALKEAFAKAKEHVAEIIVESDPVGAEVTVDGEVLGKAPRTTFVDPGQHEIVARSADGQGSERQQYDAGTRTVVRVTIAKGATPPRASRPMWPAVVGFTLGGAAVLTGFITMGISFAKASDASDAADLRCDPQSPSERCQSAFDAESAAATTGNLSFGTLLGGGLVLAATIPYLIWATSGDPKKPAARFRVVPVVTRDVQAAFLGVEF